MKCIGNKIIVNQRISLTVDGDIEEGKPVLDQISITGRDNFNGPLFCVSGLEFLYQLGLSLKETNFGYLADRESPERLVFYKKGSAVCFIPNMRTIEKEVRRLLKEEYGMLYEVEVMLNYWYFEEYFPLYEKEFDGDWGCCKVFYEDRGFMHGTDFSELSNLLKSDLVNDTLAKLGCPCYSIRHGGNHIGYYTDDDNKVRPITSRVTYTWRCDFKEKFRYLLRTGTPFFLKWFLMRYCCSSKELIRGLGGIEYIKTNFFALRDDAGRPISKAIFPENITADELAELIKSHPAFEDKIVKEFSEERAFFDNKSFGLNHSLEIYNLVKERLKEKDALYKMIAVIEKHGGKRV